MMTGFLLSLWEVAVSSGGGFSGGSAFARRYFRGGGWFKFMVGIGSWWLDS